MKQYKNTVQAIQNTVNTSTHITKTHIHYKTHTYTHPHITKPTHTHTHTLQNPHITKPTHPHITNPPTHTHQHITKQVTTTAVQDRILDFCSCVYWYIRRRLKMFLFVDWVHPVDIWCGHWSFSTWRWLMCRGVWETRLTRACSLCCSLFPLFLKMLQHIAGPSCSGSSNTSVSFKF